MAKRESWITEKENLRIKYSGLLIYTLIHIGVVLSFILFAYFTMGYGKTTFTTTYLTIVSNSNLNIILVQIFSMLIFLKFVDWYLGEHIIDLFIETKSIEEIEIFSEQKRVVNVTKEKTKPANKYFKPNLYKRKNNSVKKYLQIFIVLLIIGPVIIIFSILTADTMLKNTPHYLSTPPTFFIVAFFAIYILSDYIVLFEVLPSFRDEHKIPLFPKVIYFILLLGISCITVLFSILNYGLF